MSSNSSATTFPKHVHSIPYSDPPSRLRTLDVYLPQDPSSTPPNSPWLIYIHGGAWRDPLQDSRCVEPTLTHLLTTHSTTVSRLGGIASLNYRLSAHPTHPTSPSTPTDTERNATHPQHVRDIAAGIAYLQQHYGVTRWIGAGHSCGATMLLQLVAGLGLARAVSPGPDALLLLEGIYNFPLLLKNHQPPSCPEHVSRIYADFIAGAFGSDPAAYLAVSPVAGRYGREVWPEGRLVVVCHSYEDELVERGQRDVLCVALDREGWSIVMEEGDEEDEVRAEGSRVLNVRDLKGGHDWIWEDGVQIAKLIAEIVQRVG
ncbi:hypothetical protein ACN47E_002758 [Coniothyrium glycines]